MRISSKEHALRAHSRYLERSVEGGGAQARSCQGRNAPRRSNKAIGERRRRVQQDGSDSNDVADHQGYICERASPEYDPAVPWLRVVCVVVIEWGSSLSPSFPLFLLSSLSLSLPPSLPTSLSLSTSLPLFFVSLPTSFACPPPFSLPPPLSPPPSSLLSPSLYRPLPQLISPFKLQCLDRAGF